MSVKVNSPFRFEMGRSASMNNLSETPYFPLHDSVKDRLHSQYVEFYNQYLINSQQSHLQPISISRKVNVPFGGSAPLPVGRTEDLYVRRRDTCGPDIRIRCFVPEGAAPASGWPVTLYFRGGGWVLGNIDSENNICTNMCVRAKCVVITTEYRLAPEHPFPAALHDCWETLLWTADAGSRHLNLDVTKMAVSGCSAGANLAAAVVNRSLALRPKIKLVAQLLAVPILDNTALPANNPTWKQFEYTAALPAEKMIWYRNHYLPVAEMRSHPDASPLYFLTPPPCSRSGPSTSSGDYEGAYRSKIADIPPTLIVAGGLDVLSHEAEEYGRTLTSYGVPTVVHVIDGMPHPFLALDAVLEDGRRAISMLCDCLIRVFT